MGTFYTPLQIKYFAWDLSHKKSVSDDSKFTGVLSEAKVDLNPHQVEAALFAFKSPLSKGAIIADEVGLGKTIEAGIILSELWAEYKRKIIIVVPASLCNQWNNELYDKFYLPSIVLNNAVYKKKRLEGINPFTGDTEIIICSYNFVVSNSKIISEIDWDLVVIDEAHKLRNVYQKTNITANILKNTFQRHKKVLLTATPLQNNLKELYGLISIIDSQFFMSSDSFSEQYNKVTTRDNARYGELKNRITKIIHRTLRSQVQEYVNYTKRIPFVQEYNASDIESKLYQSVSNYLSREGTYGIPAQIRPLLSLLVRKIMSSSSYALSFTLERFIERLEEYKRTGKLSSSLSIINEDYDTFSDEREVNEEECQSISQKIVNADVDKEIDELKSYINIARSIEYETKALKLLSALSVSFDKLSELGANKKALIFTESRRTQNFLKEFLEKNGFAGKVVCFSGINDTPQSAIIYRNWIEKNKGSQRITRNVTNDKKQSLVDYFSSSAEIMIATEAGAEGINLQFCSLVVNYDMPWNPQRIEQRIGRCHRYGQKHDVVVVNFVNNRNQADVRVYQLLNNKFNLFQGVFGSSDEVLGSLESGFDFEKRLNNIYQQCRTEREINAAFDELQSELDDIIKQRIINTKKKLLENFDEEVINKLKVRQELDIKRVDTYNKHFWALAKSVLSDKISHVNNDLMMFYLNNDINESILAGNYIINKQHDDYFQLRVGHPLGRYIIDKAIHLHTDDVLINFDLSSYPYKQSLLEMYKKRMGITFIFQITSKNNYDSQQELIYISLTDNHEVLPSDFTKKMMEIPALNQMKITIDNRCETIIQENLETQLKKFNRDLDLRMNVFINDEIDKFESWEDDQVYSLENEVIDLRREVEALKRAQRKELNAMTRLDMVESIASKNKILRRKQNELSSLQDECEEKVEEMTIRLKDSMKNEVTTELFGRFMWKIL